MKTSSSLTDLRSYLSHKFYTLRTDALRESHWAKLTGGTAALATFPAKDVDPNEQRTLTGTDLVPLEKIVGTLHRQRDFDSQFRPLHKHLLNQWVNVYLTLERDGWSPIVVHRLGDRFYVEDGHVRVSIARALGKAFIQARVWEYLPRDTAQACISAECLEVPSQARAAAAD